MIQVLIFAFIQLSECLNSNKRSNSCDFDCWLKNLVINVPTISTQFETTLVFVKYKFNITLPHLVITGISLEKLNTRFYPNDIKIEDGLSVDVKVTAKLTSDIIIENTNGFFGKITGDFGANATGVEVNLALKLVQGADGLVQNVSVYNKDQCSITIDDLKMDLKVDVEWIEDFIQIFKGIITSLIKDQVGKLVCELFLEPLININGTMMFTQINDLIRPFIGGVKPIEIPIDGINKMTDLRKSNVLDLARFVLSNLTNSDGPLNLNSLVNRFTNDTGVFNYDNLASYFGLPVPLKMDIPLTSLDSTVSIVLDNLEISGLNTWSNFSFFDPISQVLLDSHSELENLGINLSFTVNVSSDGIIQTGNLDLTEKGILFLSMKDNKMDFQFQLASPSGGADNYTSTMCYDPNCVMNLASPNGTGLTKLEFHTLISTINLEAAEGSLEEEVQTLVNTVLTLFIEKYKAMIPPFLNGVINTVGAQFINQKMNETLLNNSCQYINDPVYKDYDPVITAIAFSQVITVMLIISGLLLLVKYQKDKYKKINELLLNSSNIDSNTEGSNTPLIAGKESKWLNFWRSDNNASLLMHPKLPLWVRLLVPALIFTNIAFFVSSHAGIGALVIVQIVFGDKIVEFPSMFEFSLVNSVKDMWLAKTYFLSILIAVMSCIWPYVKLILMLITWFIPATVLKKTTRAKILRLLDELGKWSLIDSIFMILMLVAFHFALYFPIINEGEITQENQCYIWVVIGYGFTSYMLSTIFSLALSHIICAVDRYAKKKEKEDEDRSRGSSNSNSEDEITSVFRNQNLASKIILCIFLVFSFILFILGISQESFTFQFVGLTGWALDLLETPNRQSYTVFDLLFKLDNAVQNPNTFIVRFPQILYFIIAIAVPIIHIMFMSVMFLVPMNKRKLSSIYITCETLYAWSCLDVFIISLLASIIQIGKFTQFMVGDRCVMIDPIIKAFFKNEDFITGHEKCFEVITYFEKGAFFMCSAAIVHTITTLWIHHCSRKVLHVEESN